MHILGVELLSQPMRVGSETFSGTVTLNADGTITGEGWDAYCAQQPGMPPTVVCGQDAASGEVATWTVADGQLIWTDEDGDHATPVTAGGRVIIFGGTAHSPGAGFSNLGILVRLPTP